MTPEEHGEEMRPEVAEGPWGSQSERPAGNSVDHNDRGQVVTADSITGGVHYHEYGEFLGEAATHRLRHAAGLGSDRVKDILATFCPSDTRKYTAFTGELAQHRLGLITGEPGRGRTHTAVHALATLSRDVSVDEVVTDPDASDVGLAGFSPDSGHPRFLDLTDLPDPSAYQRAGVRALVEKIRASGVLLVVVCRPGLWEQELAACRARLRIDSPARAEDVLRRAMTRLHGPEHAQRWAADPRVVVALSGAGPARAAELAREAERTRPPHTPLAEEDHAAWIERALKEFAEADDTLPGWSAADQGDGQNGFPRVLIQAVALLEGAPSDTVVHHAHRLAEVWKVPPMCSTPISGQGLTEYLSAIGAHVQDDRVRFHRPGQGMDALDHLWREHPDARASFQQWAFGAVSALSRKERVDAARRWLALARRHRDPAPVETLLYQWSARPALRWAAVSAIAEAAVTPELGAAVRSRLYRIATSPQVTPRDRMVLQVCRIYGRIQPGTALTRLHHIASKAPEEWTPVLITALDEIAAEPGNLALVLESLPAWTGGQGRARAVAAQVLLRVLDGSSNASDALDGLLRGAMGTALVSAAWAAALPCGAEVERVLWSWLDALAELVRGDGAAASRVTDCLMLAAQRSPGFAGVLGRCTRRWIHAHTRTSPAVDGLRRALDEI